jgi:SHAQKYF class myb-like DNA-binding protein
MSLFKKDWRRVEAYIGTRTGAQIRSHAQKFFSKVEKEVGGGGE